jgi:hypothetical protein
MYDHYDREQALLAHARNNRGHGDGEAAVEAGRASAEPDTGWWIFAWVLDLVSLF